jgi:hypothetical protein
MQIMQMRGKGEGDPPRTLTANTEQMRLLVVVKATRLEDE